MMPKTLISTNDDLFARAATTLVSTLQGVTVDLKPTSISKFTASYRDVLDCANLGSAQVISRGKKRYLLLSEDQVIALGQRYKLRSLGDVVRSVAPPSGLLDQSSLHLGRSKSEQFKLP